MRVMRVIRFMLESSRLTLHKLLDMCKEYAKNRKQPSRMYGKEFEIVVDNKGLDVTVVSGNVQLNHYRVIHLDLKWHYLTDLNFIH